MKIAIHDADKAFTRTADKFPNYALMKISAYWKAQGAEVVWWEDVDPRKRDMLDKVYSSKVFEFTPEDPFLPPDTIKGGYGYARGTKLPPEIDNMFPDYSIYPGCDYAIGFITRGCVNNCRWCGVPSEEGMIHPYREWRDLIRKDTNKLVLMDNNILSCKYGIEQLESMIGENVRIDLNQGMDARLVTPKVAEILSKLKWIKYLRFSCDQQAQIKAVLNAVKLLNECGIKASKIFIYCLITDDIDDDLTRIYAMRKAGAVTLYGMPEKNPKQGIMPNKWQRVMAQKYIYSGQWRKENWEDWVNSHPQYIKREEINT